MGEVVGAAIVSHVPPIVASDDALAIIYGAKGTTLVEGLHRLRRDKFDTQDITDVIVFDSHWFTTVEHILTAHERREGMFTSSELPRGMSGHHYDMPGDPELALRFEALGKGRDDTRLLACADPYLPVHYATTNFLPFLQKGDEAWLSMGICQTGTPEDWLLAGELLGQAIREVADKLGVELPAYVAQLDGDRWAKPKPHKRKYGRHFWATIAASVVGGAVIALCARVRHRRETLARAATTGNPHAIASASVLGKPSNRELIT